MHSDLTDTYVDPARPGLWLLESVREPLAQGAPTKEIAVILVESILKSPGMSGCQLWLRNRARQLECVMSRGETDGGAHHLVDHAASKAATQFQQREPHGSVCVPIVPSRDVIGVFQLDWTKKSLVEAVTIAEQVSLVLAMAEMRQRDIEEREKAKNELNLFYEVTKATRFTLDIEDMARFITGSLHKIVDYDVNGLLILDEPASLHIQTRAEVDKSFIGGVRQRILSALNHTCGVEVNEPSLRLHTDVLSGAQRDVPPDKPRSFLNVPLTVDGSVAGLIHLSSAQDDAFSQADVEFLNRLADFLASSVQGIKDILAAMKGRLESMVEHMADGVLMLDYRGEVVAINRAARDVLRFNPLRERRLRLNELREAMDFDPLALMKTERRSLRKVICVHDVPYQAQLSPVEDSDGALVGAVMAFRNFSREQKVDEMKSEFINIVSHELRTPLTAIKNSLCLLLGSRLGSLSEKQEHFLGLARRNTDHLIEMVSDLLDLSKIEEGRSHLKLQPLDVGVPIRSVMESMQSRCDARNVQLKAHVEEELPDIYGDVAALERVLLNVIGNAVKFTGEDGTITVEASQTREEPENPDRAWVRVVVSDTGIGVPQDQLESIFERFNQVDSARTQDVSGTGLGLPICRELLSAHHGRMWAESEQGNGSRFIFAVPQLTSKELFERELDQDLDRARRLPAHLSLSRVGAQSALTSRLQQLEEPKRRELVEALEAAAQAVIRRSTDRLVFRPDTFEFFAVLLDTPRVGAGALARRLVEELRKAASEHGVDLNSDAFVCGYALFPEEAATAARLIERASQSTESEPENKSER